MIAALGIVVSMTIVVGIVVGIAAGVLFVWDRVTLRSSLTPDERKAIIEKRTEAWQRRWGIFYLTMAAIALVVNALNLGHESLRFRIGTSVPAAAVVIWFRLSKNEKTDDRQ